MSQDTEKQHQAPRSPLSAEELRNMVNPDRKKSKLERFGRAKQITTLGTLAALLATGAFIFTRSADSSQSDNAPAPNQPTAEAPVTPGTQETTEPESPEVVETASESEANFAAYLESLSPEQRAVRESLTPDKLIAMSQAELTEAFTIKAEEVTDPSGQIDPELYAEAFAARINGVDSAGCTEAEYDKWGGYDNQSVAAVESSAEWYVSAASNAFIRGGVAIDTTVQGIQRCSIVDRVLADSSIELKPAERYAMRITVMPDSIHPTVNPDGSVDISFGMQYADNWEKETMRQAIGREGDAYKSNEFQDVIGVRIDETGTVLPTDVVW